MAETGTDKPPDEGITSIRVQGFKSLVDSGEVRIAPLTLLAGANSSGKSSLMQPLLLLKQTLESPYDPGGLLLDGPHVSFSATRQFLSKGSDGLNLRVGLGREWCWLNFELGTSGRLEPLAAATGSANGPTGTLRSGMSTQELYNENDANLLVSVWRALASGATAVPPIRVGTRRGLLVVEVGDLEIDQKLIGLGPLSSKITSILHVPGNRGSAERSYPLAATGSHTPGPFPPYTASLILSWQRSPYSPLSALGEDLAYLDLAHGLAASQPNEGTVSLSVSRLPRLARLAVRDRVDVADTGMGIGYSLPVLVALRAAQPGQLVYIEQPELHLHPRAQLGLATILVEAAKRGVRVVAETHSELLLLGVQTAIARGEIDPKDVALHWFERGDDGVTKITTAEIDDVGTFGDWPEDFGNVALDAQEEFLNAVHSRRTGK